MCASAGRGCPGQPPAGWSKHRRPRSRLIGLPFGGRSPALAPASPRHVGLGCSPSERSRTTAAPSTRKGLWSVPRPPYRPTARTRASSASTCSLQPRCDLVLHASRSLCLVYSPGTTSARRRSMILMRRRSPRSCARTEARLRSACSARARSWGCARWRSSARRTGCSRIGIRRMRATWSASPR